MLKKVVWGTLLGGIAAFAVGAVWWMVLPWQGQSVKAVSDENAVASVFRSQVSHSGVYVIPNYDMSKKNPLEQQKIKESMKQGPLVFASVKLEGRNPADPALYLKGLTINLTGAMLLSWLLLTVSGLSYWGRVKTVVIVSAIVGVLGYLPAWLWWGFSTEYTASTIAGLMVAWFAAALILAKIVVHPDDESILG